MVIDGRDHKLPYIVLDISRTLVDVSTNPANKYESIITLFSKKLVEYTTVLTSCTLSPTDIMEGYYRF